MINNDSLFRRIKNKIKKIPSNFKKFINKIKYI